MDLDHGENKTIFSNFPRAISSDVIAVLAAYLTANKRNFSVTATHKTSCYGMLRLLVSEVLFIKDFSLLKAYACSNDGRNNTDMVGI